MESDQLFAQGITAHPWCDGHSTSISACGVLGAGPRFKFSGGSFTHIYLN